MQLLNHLHAQGLFLLTMGIFIMWSRCLATEEAVSNPLVVQTPSGAIRGKVEPVVYGLSVRQFLGIPYAEPPIGKLRFAKPQPSKPWTGTKEAVEFGPICPQIPDDQFMKMLNLHVPGEEIVQDPQSEDCLSLNVYTPEEAKPGDNKAVMVWVHGGGMTMGTGRIYDPSVLVSLYDVIVVTINYRLGVLGFFNILGTDVTGNYGMHDQVLAFKWVQKNIASFGGNPDSVTIFGESAGGMSVSMHLVSPLSKGLFHHVIAQSGSSAANTFISIKPKSTAQPELYANLTGCSFDEGLMECLRGKSTEDIFSAQLNVSYPQYTGEATLTVPTIDGDFLPDDTRELLREGRVNKADVIIGVMANEGVLFAMMAPNGMQDGLTRQGFEYAIKHGLQLAKNQNSLIEEAMRHEYTDHRDPENNATIRQQYIDLMSDVMFVAPAVFEATALARHGQSPYFYVVEHMPDFTKFRAVWMSSAHCIDVPYVFGVPLSVGHSGSLVKALARRFSAREVGYSMSIMKMWTDFAKHGDPNHSGELPVTWPQYNTTAQAHLVIALEPRVEYKFHADRVAFWNEFIPKLADAKPETEQQLVEKTTTEGTNKEEL